MRRPDKADSVPWDKFFTKIKGKALVVRNFPYLCTPKFLGIIRKKMYAIVDIAGQQFKVEKNQQIFVNRLEGKEGDSVKFDNVLLIDKGGKVDVGMPTVKGASVSTKIISHLKADKVLVFKKKRRKGYAKLNGHRQLLTKIEIQAINA